MKPSRKILGTTTILVALLGCGELPGTSADGDDTGPTAGEDELILFDDADPEGEDYTVAEGWDHTDLTWCIDSLDSDLDEGETIASIQRSTNEWAANCSFTLTRLSRCDDADIVINFASKDGVNQVLASAYYPTYGGDITFDTSETWTDAERATGGQPIDLQTVALHEFGHSIGLGHSEVETAVMYKWYGGSKRDVTSDDANGCEELYGEPDDGESEMDDDGDGWTVGDGDCDDDDADVNPGTSEVCDNEVDDDCDGRTDEGCAGSSRDNDSDGYSENAGDCDDRDADVFPGATEVCFDDVDQDCSGEDDDTCMYVGTTTIQLEPDAGMNTYYVDYPDSAKDTVAFLAVNKLIEHGDDADDQCDFQTEITDEGDRYRFEVFVEHCGYGDYGSSYGFEAQAVVFADLGGVGGFADYDMDTTPDIGGDHRVYGSTVVAETDASEELTFCAVYSADGEGDVDTEWYCDASLEDRNLAGELYEDYGNDDTWVAARFMTIGLSENLAGTLVPFECANDETTTYSYSVSDRLGDDHTAIIILDDWDTDASDNQSFESACELDDDVYECSVTCYGHGDDAHTNGNILFLDGSFQ